jgi:hypothetical protein
VIASSILSLLIKQGLTLCWGRKEAFKCLHTWGRFQVLDDTHLAKLLESLCVLEAKRDVLEEKVCHSLKGLREKCADVIRCEKEILAARKRIIKVEDAITSAQHKLEKWKGQIRNMEEELQAFSSDLAREASTESMDSSTSKQQKHAKKWTKLEAIIVSLKAKENKRQKMVENLEEVKETCEARLEKKRAEYWHRYEYMRLQLALFMCAGLAYYMEPVTKISELSLSTVQRIQEIKTTARSASLVGNSTSDKTIVKFVHHAERAWENWIKFIQLSVESAWSGQDDAKEGDIGTGSVTDLVPTEWQNWMRAFSQSMESEHLAELRNAVQKMVHSFLALSELVTSTEASKELKAHRQNGVRQCLIEYLQTWEKYSISNAKVWRAMVNQAEGLAPMSQYVPAASDATTEQAELERLDSLLAEEGETVQGVDTNKSNNDNSNDNNDKKDNNNNNNEGVTAPVEEEGVKEEMDAATESKLRRVIQALKPPPPPNLFAKFKRNKGSSNGGDSEEKEKEKEKEKGPTKDRNQ